MFSLFHFHPFFQGVSYVRTPMSVIDRLIELRFYVEAVATTLRHEMAIASSLYDR